jgi:hypothetical protein
MELKHLTKEELFRRYDGDLALRVHGRALKEARRILKLFQAFIGAYPPSASLAKGFLGQFTSRKPATMYRYTSVLKGLCE